MDLNDLFNIVFDVDVKVVEWLQSFAGEALTKTAQIIGYLGGEFILLAVVGFFYWSYSKEMGQFIGTNAVVSLVASPLCKFAVNRVGPNPADGNISNLYEGTKCKYIGFGKYGDSFVSAPALNTVSVYGTIGACARRVYFSVLSILFILAVGLADVYLGNSYPTDVIIAWLGGCVLVYLVSFFLKKLQSRLTIAVILSAVTIPGWFYIDSDVYYKSYGILVGVLFGFWFESVAVNFGNTPIIARRIIRFVVGFVLTVGLSHVVNLVAPMIFTPEQIGGNDIVAHAITAGEYFIVSFIMVGIYPAFFKLTDKIRGQKL